MRRSPAIISRFINRIDTHYRFAEWGPDANPLIVRWKRQPTRFTLRTALWLAFGVGMVGTAGLTWSILHTTRRSASLGVWLLFAAGWLLVLLAPLLTATLAASLTRLHTRPERFDVLYLTPLPNDVLVWALVFQVLYRLRGLYALLIGLFPFMVLPLVHSAIGATAGSYWSYNYYAPSYWEVITPTLLALVTILGAWGMNGVAAAAGVRMALLRENSAVAVIGSPVITCLAMISPCVVCTGFYILLGPALFNSPSTGCSLICVAGPVLLGWPLVMLFGPYLLIANSLRRTAERWGR